MTDVTQPVRSVAPEHALALRRPFWPAVLGTARLELSLSSRSLTFWLVQLAILAATLLVLVPDGFRSTFLRYSSQQLRELAAFTLLLLPLLALPGLQRLQGARGDLVLATTHDNVAHALGTILGIFSWLIPATLLQLLGRWLIGELVGGQANWTLLTTTPWLALAALVLGIGVLACLSLIWRRVLPILLVWLGLWVLVLQLSGGLMGGFVGPYMPLFSPWNVFYEGLLLSPAAGLGWSRALVANLALTMAAAGLASLSAWVVLAPVSDPRRSNRRRRLPAATLLVALLLVGLTQVGFQREIGAQVPAMTPRSVTVDVWRVVTSDLDVVIDPAAAQPISGTAALTLEATGDAPDALILRLRPAMRLTATVGGRQLDVTRDGDSVTVLVGSLGLDSSSRVDVQLSFEGTPRWPYSDHRFQIGGAFPVLDSNQPITGAIVDGAGYLLRDGDWRPWPWTTGAQIAVERDTITIRVGDAVIEYEGGGPQLLAAIPPRNAQEQGNIQVGVDPSAGLRTALENVSAGAELLWPLLGETAIPRVIALPYLPDVYANADTIVIPEAYGLSHDLQVGAAYQRDLPPEMSERSGYVLAARAWLNGNARHPRAYAEATQTRRAMQGSDLGPGSGDGYRLLQVTSVGPLGSPWSPLWRGSDPGPYAVNPFALWLGIELADPAVRQDDLELLRQVTGVAQDYLRLRQRGLPWGLARQSSDVAMTLALADWADTVGRERAIRLFAEVYTTIENQDQRSLLTALGTMSGTPLTQVETGGNP